jgi:dUTPase
MSVRVGISRVAYGLEVRPRSGLGFTSSLPTTNNMNDVDHNYNCLCINRLDVLQHRSIELITMHW